LIAFGISAFSVAEFNPRQKIMMEKYATPGEQARFTKTVTDADMFAFGGISADFDPVHVDDEYGKATPFGRRIVYGLLTMALLSGPESEMSRRIAARGCPLRPVTLGYDRVRCLTPAFVGDTLTAIYTLESLDEEKKRSVGDCRVVNQNGQDVLVAKHLMKWVGES
jgi:acyl dehydratase